MRATGAPRGAPPPPPGGRGSVVSLISTLELKRNRGMLSAFQEKDDRYGTLLRFLVGEGRPVPDWLKPKPVPEEGNLEPSSPDSKERDGKPDPETLRFIPYDPAFAFGRPREICFPPGRERHTTPSLRVEINPEKSSSSHKSQNTPKEVCICVLDVEILEVRLQLSILSKMQRFFDQLRLRQNPEERRKARIRKRCQRLLQKKRMQEAADSRDAGSSGRVLLASSPVKMAKGPSGLKKKEQDEDWLVDVALETEVINGGPAPPKDATQGLVESLPPPKEAALCEVQSMGAQIKQALEGEKTELTCSSLTTKEEAGFTTFGAFPGRGSWCAQTSKGSLKGQDDCYVDSDADSELMLMRVPMPGMPPFRLYVPVVCTKGKNPEATALSLRLSFFCRLSSDTEGIKVPLAQGAVSLSKPLFLGLVQLSTTDCYDSEDAMSAAPLFAGVARVHICCRGLLFRREKSRSKQKEKVQSTHQARPVEATSSPPPSDSKDKEPDPQKVNRHEQQQHHRHRSPRTSGRAEREAIALPSPVAFEKRVPLQLPLERRHDHHVDKVAALSTGRLSQVSQADRRPTENQMIHGSLHSPHGQQQQQTASDPGYGQALRVVVYLKPHQRADEKQQQHSQQQQPQHQATSAAPLGQITLGLRPLHQKEGAGEFLRLERLLIRLQRDPSRLYMEGLVWARRPGYWPTSVAELRSVLSVLKPLKSNGRSSVHLVSFHCPGEPAAGSTPESGLCSGMYILQSIGKKELLDPFGYMRALLEFSHIPSETNGDSEQASAAQKGELPPKPPLSPIESPLVVRLHAIYHDACCVHVLREWLPPPAGKLSHVIPPHGKCAFNEAAARAVLHQLLQALQLLRKQHEREMYIQLIPDAIYLRQDGRVALALPRASRFCRKQQAWGSPSAALLYKPSFQYPLRDSGDEGLKLQPSGQMTPPDGALTKEEPTSCFPLAYMAPEELQTTASRAPSSNLVSPTAAGGPVKEGPGDIWRLGVLACHLLTGGVPFIANSHQALRALLARRGIIGRYTPQPNI